MSKKKTMALELMPPPSQWCSEDLPEENNVLPSQWKPEEDDILKELVKRYGSKKWDVVASRIPGRSAPECKERWHAQLHASMNKSSWTEEEDRKLLDARKACGNRWMEIAQRVPGRTDNAVKNRYQALKRKQAEEAALSSAAALPGFLMGPPEAPPPKQKRKYTKRANKESQLGAIAEEDLPIGLPSTSGIGASHVDKKPCTRPELSIQIPSTTASVPALPLSLPLSLPMAMGPTIGAEPLAYPTTGRLTPNFFSSEAIQQLLAGSLTDTPRESIDMDEVMGWLTSQTPTPSTHFPGTATTTAANSLASSLFPSASNTPARLTPSPGNLAGFKFTGPSPRQLMSAGHSTDDRTGFAFGAQPFQPPTGQSPANLMGPQLNVSELEDLVRLLSGSEGADRPTFQYPDVSRRNDHASESFPPLTAGNRRLSSFMDSTRGLSFDHLNHTVLHTQSLFNDRIR